MPVVDVEDTIAAIASAPGSGLRGIIRLTGPDCQRCLRTAFQFDCERNNAGNRPFVVPADLLLEHNLSLPGHLMVWPTERSYTRQPSAEFHTIGSPPLLELALAKICESGARLADRGEFTLRAFLSGRLDLTQAEAVLAIIDSTAESQLAGALKQLAGGLSGPLSESRDQLLFVLAELEAGLDFVEEDIEFISHADLVSRLDEILKTLTRIVEQISSRNLATASIRVALIGLPNAGKSSLFNALLGSEKAIVTELAGTTTDFLVGQIEIDGLKIDLIDTAGLEASGNFGDSEISIADAAQVQREFIELNSQLQLLCVDSSRDLTGLTTWEKDRLASPTMILVQTKSDIVVVDTETVRTPLPIRPRDVQLQFYSVRTSVKNSLGLDNLRQILRQRALTWLESDSEIVGTTVLRAADSLRAATESVKLAQTAALDQVGEEVVAAEIRAALDDLGLVVGTVYTDDILDIVFGRFCIGK